MIPSITNQCSRATNRRFSLTNHIPPLAKHVPSLTKRLPPLTNRGQSVTEVGLRNATEVQGRDIEQQIDSSHLHSIVALTRATIAHGWRATAARLPSSSIDPEAAR